MFLDFVPSRFEGFMWPLEILQIWLYKVIFLVEINKASYVIAKKYLKPTMNYVYTIYSSIKYVYNMYY